MDEIRNNEVEGYKKDTNSSLEGFSEKKDTEKSEDKYILEGGFNYKGTIRQFKMTVNNSEDAEASKASEQDKVLASLGEIMDKEENQIYYLEDGTFDIDAYLKDKNDKLKEGSLEEIMDEKKNLKENDDGDVIESDGIIKNLFQRDETNEIIDSKLDKSDE